MVYSTGPNSKLSTFVTKIHKSLLHELLEKEHSLFRRYVQILTLVQIYRLGARYFYRCILPKVEERYILFETRMGI